MCGIVAACSSQQHGIDIVPILLFGLSKLEYRGYDSSGIAILKYGKSSADLEQVKSLGKVDDLVAKVNVKQLHSNIGVAHTRWATHGVPSVINAHPHKSEHLAVVHNGIIENYLELKEQLIKEGYKFISQTDTEVIVHLLHSLEKKIGDLRQAILQSRKILQGSYGMVVISEKLAEQIIAARSGSPIVIGFAANSNFVASDVLALTEYTNQFYYLEEGEIAIISPEKVTVLDEDDRPVNYQISTYDGHSLSSEKGDFAYYMEKEIYDQPQAINDTLEGRIIDNQLSIESLGVGFVEILNKIENIVIVACGTSFHAALTAKYWFEEIAAIPTEVEIASEFRYRNSITRTNSLFITISQSGETADLLAALKKAKQVGFLHTLSICNVSTSSLVRESDLAIMTRAGVEVSVASTKAFTTQLVNLLLIAVAFAKINSRISKQDEINLLKNLIKLPEQINNLLANTQLLKQAAQNYTKAHHALFLARGILYPIAQEGALKMKEISYIHCEAYASGELKHGALALIDENFPVIALAPSNHILEKVKSNLSEVLARKGKILVFTDKKANLQEIIKDNSRIQSIELEIIAPILQPIYFTVPLQLLSYYTALALNKNPDRPRNLAKSVTVE